MRVRQKGFTGWLKQLGGDYRELETRYQHGNILMTALKLTDGVHHRPQRRS